jgi:hypothetical protein
MDQDDVFVKEFNITLSIQKPISVCAEPNFDLILIRNKLLGLCYQNCLILDIVNVTKTGFVKLQVHSENYYDVAFLAKCITYNPGDIIYGRVSGTKELPIVVDRNEKIRVAVRGRTLDIDLFLPVVLSTVEFQMYSPVITGTGDTFSLKTHFNYAIAFNNTQINFKPIKNLTTHPMFEKYYRLIFKKDYIQEEPRTLTGNYTLVPGLFPSFVEAPFGIDAKDDSKSIVFAKYNSMITIFDYILNTYTDINDAKLKVFLANIE